MGKRSNFKRRELDAYYTPFEAVEPLIPFLQKGQTFCEPAAGDGRLISHLERAGMVCVAAHDISPSINGFGFLDASMITSSDINNADMIITNPPWDRPLLHQIIERCANIASTWLLFDADWMHTKQARHHLEICTHIVSIGRVQWIEGTNQTGKDNCCWYKFDARRYPVETKFFGRK
jgi:hypothetical protein